MWFHFEIKHGHMFLFPFTLSFLQYSIWRKVPVTGLSQCQSTVHSDPLCQTRTLAMGANFFLFT